MIMVDVMLQSLFILLDLLYIEKKYIKSKSHTKNVYIIA